MYVAKIRVTPFSLDTPATQHVYTTHHRSISDKLVCRDTPGEILFVTLDVNREHKKNSDAQNHDGVKIAIIETAIIP